MNTIGAITVAKATQTEIQTIPSTIGTTVKPDTGTQDPFGPIFKAIESEMQSRSDLGQKLQLQLNEANSLYNRSIQAKSNIASTHNKTADALVQNIRG
jgi:hypothetical protein